MNGTTATSHSPVSTPPLALATITIPSQPSLASIAVISSPRGPGPNTTMERLEWLPAPAVRTGQAATRRHSRPGQARPPACRNTTTRSCRRRHRRHRRSCRRRRSVASKMAVRSGAQSPRSYRWPEAVKSMDVSLRYRAPRYSCSSALYSGGSALCSPLPGPEGSPEQAGFWSAGWSLCLEGCRTHRPL